MKLAEKQSRNSDKIHSSLATGICETKGLQLMKVVVLLNNGAEGPSLLPFSINYPLPLWLMGYPSAVTCSISHLGPGPARPW